MLVRWTKPAANDLTPISDYTQQHFGPAQARRAALAIHEAADSLITLPSRGRPDVSQTPVSWWAAVRDDLPRP
jgi:plasmid stabilization system protein ParE